MSVPGYSRGSELLQALGSFWSRFFSQKSFIKSFTDGTELQFDQEYFRILELVLCKSIHDIPVFSRKKWTLLLFKESELQSEESGFFYDPSAPVYGPQAEPTEYEPGREYAYGNFLSNNIYAFRLPDNLININTYVTNKIISPTLVLVKNSDFLIYANRFIIFSSNPFENPKVPKRNITDSTGAVIDREIALWSLNSDTDAQYLYKNYGSVLNIAGESSQEYKDLLRVIFAYFTLGATVELVVSVCNIILGYPVTRDTETVQDIRQVSTSKLLVTTDCNCYTLPGTLADTSLLDPTVFVGASLKAFQPLLNIVEVKDSFNSRKWWSNLPFAILPKNILGEAFLSSLMVPNTTTEFQGKYGATAELSMSADTTPELQELLENYPLKYGMSGFKYGPNQFDPSVSTSVVLLNELDYMMESFFKNNLFLLRAKLNAYHRFSEAGAKALFQGLPAHVFPLIIFEYTTDQEVYPAGPCEHMWLDGNRRIRPAPAINRRAPLPGPLASHHPVWPNYEKSFRFRDSCDPALSLIHFTAGPDAEPLPDCLPSRGVEYYSGDTEYQTELALQEFVLDTYFYNTTESQWYRYNSNAWDLLTDCASPENLRGVIDVALNMGYGPEFPKEKIAINSVRTGAVPGMDDGKYGVWEYGRCGIKYGDPVTYGEKIMCSELFVARVPATCATA